MFNPKTDGVDHLNVYSKGQTELGRWMSNFTKEPITTVYGQFQSVEGYWYWLGNPNEQLRTLHGFAAKQLGRSLPRIAIRSENEFQSLIRDALYTKAKRRPDMVAKLRKCTLPLAHYYVFGNPPVVKDAGHQWILDCWDEIRTMADTEYNSVE